MQNIICVLYGLSVFSECYSLCILVCSSLFDLHYGFADALVSRESANSLIKDTKVSSKFWIACSRQHLNLMPLQTCKSASKQVD